MQTNEEIFASHPAKIFVWLQEWLQAGKPIEPDSEINWLGLAETSAANACSLYRNYSIADSFLWGSISISIQEALSKTTPAKEFSNRYACAMQVRTNLIIQFGNYPADPICDAQLVLDWFYQTLKFSVEECERLIGIWPNPEATGNFEFKMVFDRLEMLRCLCEAKRISADQSLLGWLGLLGQFEKTKQATRNYPPPDPSEIKITYTSDLF